MEYRSVVINLNEIYATFFSDNAVGSITWKPFIGSSGWSTLVATMMQRSRLARDTCESASHRANDESIQRKNQTYPVPRARDGFSGRPIRAHVQPVNFTRNDKAYHWNYNRIVTLQYRLNLSYGKICTTIDSLILRRGFALRVEPSRNLRQYVGFISRIPRWKIKISIQRENTPFVIVLNLIILRCAIKPDLSDIEPVVKRDNNFPLWKKIEANALPMATTRIPSLIFAAPNTDYFYLKANMFHCYNCNWYEIDRATVQNWWAVFPPIYFSRKTTLFNLSSHPVESTAQGCYGNRRTRRTGG